MSLIEARMYKQVVNRWYFIYDKQYKLEAEEFRSGIDDSVIERAKTGRPHIKVLYMPDGEPVFIRDSELYTLSNF